MNAPWRLNVSEPGDPRGLRWAAGFRHARWRSLLNQPACGRGCTPLDRDSRRGVGRSGSSVLGVVEVHRPDTGDQSVLPHGCPPEIGAGLDRGVGPAAVGLVTMMRPTQGREVRVGGLAAVRVWGDVV